MSSPQKAAVIFSGGQDSTTCLFLALQLKLVKVHQIDSPARALTDNMGLFFIPAGVGLMAQLDTVVANWWVILVAVIVSSILVIASVAYVQDQMERRRK